MLLFIYFIVTGSDIVPSQFLNDRPCECDTSSSCDLFCCCDSDCSEDTLASFRNLFCLPESVNPIFRISCDLSGHIESKNLNSIRTFQEDGNTCYNVTNPTGKEITQIELADIGLTVDDVVSTPSVPTVSSYALSYNSGTTYSNRNFYVPISIGGGLCNARVLLRTGMTGAYSSCDMDLSFGNSTNINVSAILGEFIGSSVTANGSQLTVTLAATTFNVTSSTPVDSNNTNSRVIITGTSLTNGVSGLTYSGYSTRSLVVYNDNSVIRPLQINDQNVFFGQSFKISVPLGTQVNFSSMSFCPTYGCTATEHLTLTNVSGSGNSSDIYYTMMYRKNGNSSDTTFRYIGVNSSVLSNNLGYNRVILEQIELSDDGTTLYSPSNSRYYLKFSDIFSFLFYDSSRIDETLGVLGFFCILILIWIDDSINE